MQILDVNIFLDKFQSVETGILIYYNSFKNFVTPIKVFGLD